MTAAVARRRRPAGLQAEEVQPMLSRDDVFVALLQQIGRTQEQMHEGLQAHLKHCHEREEKATQHRHDFRAEMAVRFNTLDMKIDRLASDGASRRERWLIGLLSAAVGVVGFLFGKQLGWF